MLNCESINLERSTNTLFKSRVTNPENIIYNILLYGRCSVKSRIRKTVPERFEFCLSEYIHIIYYIAYVAYHHIFLLQAPWFWEDKEVQSLASSVVNYTSMN